jgi:hypothetical protein
MKPPTWCWVHTVETERARHGHNGHEIAQEMSRHGRRLLLSPRQSRLNVKRATSGHVFACIAPNVDSQSQDPFAHRIYIGPCRCVVAQPSTTGRRGAAPPTTTYWPYLRINGSGTRVSSVESSILWTPIKIAEEGSLSVVWKLV